jgi:hypothetical protein
MRYANGKFEAPFFQDDCGAFIFWREWSRKIHFCLIVPDVIQWESVCETQIVFLLHSICQNRFLSKFPSVLQHVT